MDLVLPLAADHLRRIAQKGTAVREQLRQPTGFFQRGRIVSRLDIREVAGKERRHIGEEAACAGHWTGRFRDKAARQFSPRIEVTVHALCQGAMTGVPRDAGRLSNCEGGAEAPALERGCRHLSHNCRSARSDPQRVTSAAGQTTPPLPSRPNRRTGQPAPPGRAGSHLPRGCARRARSWRDCRKWR